MNFSAIFLTTLLAVQLSKSVLCQEQSHLSLPALAKRQTPNKRGHMLLDLKDGVDALTSLDVDLQTRVRNIESKLSHFEAHSLELLDSLAAQQKEILKRLDALDYVERQTKQNTDELNEQQKEEEKVVRVQRDSDDRLPLVPTIEDKLDSLATFLLSTRVAVGELDKQLQLNITRLINVVSRRQKKSDRQKNRRLSHSHPNEQGITSCLDDDLAVKGILRLQLTPDSKQFYVRCDGDILGGGWIIIQNRFSGKLNFNRDWLDYQAGFGNLDGEFFIGLEKLHALTESAVQELLILLEDFDGEKRYARYNLFAIGSEKEDYALNLLGEYEGDAGDSLSYHSGSKFSTFDNDNDGCVFCNCAVLHNGAWWYNWCDMSNLNGKYFSQNFNDTPPNEGMYWENFNGPNYSLKSVRMLIRPVSADVDE